MVSTDYSDDINPAVSSQEDMSFYEINPCEVYYLNLLEKCQRLYIKIISLSI